MSEYWSATSGTALVFPKEEVRDFSRDIFWRHTGRMV